MTTAEDIARLLAQITAGEVVTIPADVTLRASGPLPPRPQSGWIWTSAQQPDGTWLLYDVRQTACP